MYLLRCVLAAMLLAEWAVAGAAETQPAEPVYFSYDKADQVVDGLVVDRPEYYDAHVARIGEELWAIWLQFVPGEGDHVWLARYEEGDFRFRRRVTEDFGQYAGPRITAGIDGRAWVTYEALVKGQWEVLLSPVNPADYLPPVALRLSDNPGPDIHHRTAAAPDGALWVVWQSGTSGQFDILARRIDAKGASAPVTISNSTRGDWHPDIAVTNDGTVYVAWDGHDGLSYNVYARVCRDGQWGEVVTVAGTPAFEGRPCVEAGPDGRVWALWEQGSENWGRRYISRMRLKSQDYFEMTDTCGPLHRFRELRIARLDADGRGLLLKSQLPMPSLAEALQRPDAPADCRRLGAYYERGRLRIDDDGRLWVFYRQYYVPWLGIRRYSHKEEGWGVYARCLGADGWSKLYRCEVNQGDGMQSLAVTPFGGDMVAVYTTGRTDRRENDRPRGVVLSRLAAEDPAPAAAQVEEASHFAGERPPADAPERPAPTLIRGRRHELYFGDLHRHTDLSLCFVPADGTIDDAYRYAIDVGGLDFLGITDHARDLAMGNEKSQLWWRCRKEVTRHTLEPVFFPYFSYERSRAAADHNVISLRPNMLRPHTYPHAKFWEELNDDTITIPHQTVTDPIEDPNDPPNSLGQETWRAHDNDLRPLLEIYQGCRDRSIEKDAHEGLARRYLFGFIASSDHVSTGGSFACVWAQDRTRESIFRAMQARRTFGATDHIRLVVRAGDRFMGEHFEGDAMPPIHIEADGTAPIASIDLIVNGQVTRTLTPGQQRVVLDHDPGITQSGFHYLYVRLEQTDGNRAWSSPLWIEIP